MAIAINNQAQFTLAAHAQAEVEFLNKVEDGESLESLIQRDEDLASKVLFLVAEAVSSLHTSEWGHGDLRPKNIYLCGGQIRFTNWQFACPIRIVPAAVSYDLAALKSFLPKKLWKEFMVAYSNFNNR